MSEADADRLLERAKQIMADFKALAAIADSLVQYCPQLRPQWALRPPLPKLGGVSSIHLSLEDQWRHFAEWLKHKAIEYDEGEITTAPLRSAVGHGESELKVALRYVDEWVKNYKEANKAFKAAKSGADLIKRRSIERKAAAQRKIDLFVRKAESKTSF